MARLLGASFRGVETYGVRGVRADVIAGVTVWAVLVPETLAYATIAGVPPVVGLYAAVAALLLYPLLGSSRHLIVAPMSATAVLSAAIVGTVCGAGAGPAEVAALTAGLALATGLIAIAAGLLRLGFLASFISAPVLKGFVIGLVLTIVIGQVPELIGAERTSGSFVAKAWDLLTHLSQVDALTLAVGGASLATLLVLRRFVPVVPGALVVAMAAVAAVTAFGLDDHGLAIVGPIQSALPAVGWPGITGRQLLDLSAASVGLLLIGFVEGLGAARTYANQYGYELDPNRELLGLGLSNLGSGLASGMVVNGSMSKTAVNGAAGARTQLSALTAAVLAAGTVLFLTGLFEPLPDATLAAVVISAVVDLVDVAGLRRLWRAGRSRVTTVNPLSRHADFVAAMGALVGVLVLDTLTGLIIGVALSMLLLLARVSRPNICTLVPVGTGPGRVWVDTRRHPSHASIPGTLVVRVDGPLIFANAEFVRTSIRRLATATPELRIVVLDGRATPSLDVTAAGMLDELRADLRRQAGDLVLAGDIGQVRDVLAATDSAVDSALFVSVDAALDSLGSVPTH